jgi:hypothetical protein
VNANRIRIRDWLDRHRSCRAFGRFEKHFDVLDQVLSSMLDALTAELGNIEVTGSSGAAYDRCGRLDRSLVVVLRLFDWYSSKYDQRLDDEFAPALRAADEVVRSCWSEPFALLGRNPPTGPLAYFDVQFDAFATPRISVPADLRGPVGSLVADFVRELPIPTIALPEYASREAWWLVLAAHETGHHVQKDLLPELERVTRERLADAAPATPEADPGGSWASWGQEAFADAYSTLMVGEAAAWAIDELQYSAPASLYCLARPGSRYPPPAVRGALLGECLRMAGMHAPWPGAVEIFVQLDRLRDVVAPVVRDAVAGQLATVPAVAAALLDLPVGPHRLRELGNVQSDLLTRPDQLRGWAAQLTRAHAALPSLGEPAAARLVIAAGVAAYRNWAGQPSAASVLPVVQENLLALLPACGPPGVLEAPPSLAEVTALAGRLSSRLLRETPDEEDR